MEKKKAGWQQKLLLLAASSVFVVTLIGLGELYCRLFTRINFLDSSRGLFTAGRFGNSYGNTPNFEGISFGEKFYIDENGFRVDSTVEPDSRLDSPAIMILGDSVAFGPALTEDKTLAGILRRAIPHKRIYNAAVVGYDTFDYFNAGRKITAAKPEIKQVLLFYCLNDVSDASAQIIRSQSTPTGAEPAGARSIPRHVNDYLRSRSKLFLWLKSALLDTQMIYFRNDLAGYQRGEENIHDGLWPLVDLKNNLATKGVSFTVFILPYEAQLRPNPGPGFFDPQRLTAAFFQQNGIDFYDLAPEFQKVSDTAKSLFLYGDPMHLSADGTRVVADAVCGRLPDCR
ncbi:MAG: hypothetical protein ABR535_05365 [Pyrinomonadaceae bacterium]